MPSYLLVRLSDESILAHRGRQSMWRPCADTPGPCHVLWTKQGAERCTIFSPGRVELPVQMNTLEHLWAPQASLFLGYLVHCVNPSLSSTPEERPCFRNLHFIIPCMVVEYLARNHPLLRLLFQIAFPLLFFFKATLLPLQDVPAVGYWGIELTVCSLPAPHLSLSPCPLSVPLSLPPICPSLPTPISVPLSLAPSLSLSLSAPLSVLPFVM